MLPRDRVQVALREHRPGDLRSVLAPRHDANGREVGIACEQIEGGDGEQVVVRSAPGPEGAPLEPVLRHLDRDLQDVAADRGGVPVDG